MSCCGFAQSSCGCSEYTYLLVRNIFVFCFFFFSIFGFLLLCLFFHFIFFGQSFYVYFSYFSFFLWIGNFCHTPNTTDRQLKINIEPVVHILYRGGLDWFGCGVTVASVIFRKVFANENNTLGERTWSHAARSYTTEYT